LKEKNAKTTHLNGISAQTFMHITHISLSDFYDLRLYLGRYSEPRLTKFSDYQSALLQTETHFTTQYYNMSSKETI
jgi:hypothetical protein